MNDSSSFSLCLAFACLPDIRFGGHQYIEASPPKIYWFVTITHAFDYLVLSCHCRSKQEKNAAREAPSLQLFTVKADNGY